MVVCAFDTQIKLNEIAIEFEKCKQYLANFISVNESDVFEPYEVVATTYQAISGAGKTFKEWPEMIENIIPYIGGEEEKSEKEPLKLWGKIEDGKIVPATSPNFTAQCIRVPVSDGHMGAVFMRFEDGKKPSKEEIIKALIYASAVGAIYTRNATVAGADGGCQAECGVASSMAAAAAAYLKGADDKACFDAAKAESAE